MLVFAYKSSFLNHPNQAVMPMSLRFLPDLSIRLALS